MFSVTISIAFKQSNSQTVKYSKLLLSITNKMSYSPNTVFRAYVQNESKHYTAVLLKDGTILEVKNPNSIVKRRFDSLEVWQSILPTCTLKIDDSKACGVVIGSDTNGFNYPTEKHPAYLWIQWCYSIVKEAAPDFLLSITDKTGWAEWTGQAEEFRLLYNKSVDICNKYKHIFYHSFSRKKSSRYSESRYRTPEYTLTYFKNSTKSSLPTKDYTNARNEIVTAYKAIINIITPEIKDYMAMKYKILNTKRKINTAKTSIKRFEKKIAYNQHLIKTMTTSIENETINLNRLEEELNNAKSHTT